MRVAVGLGPAESPETYAERLRDAVGSDPSLVLADLAGGTPANVALARHARPSRRGRRRRRHPGHPPRGRHQPDLTRRRRDRMRSSRRGAPASLAQDDRVRGCETAMTLKLVRVDDRLIHGQVVAVWLRAVGAQRIVIVDDRTARDEFLRDSSSSPRRRASRWRSTTSRVARARDASLPRRARRSSCSCARPIAALQLRKAGVPFDVLNVGGIGAGPGRRPLYRNISASEEERAAMRELEGMGTRVELRIVADDRPVTFGSVDKGTPEGQGDMSRASSRAMARRVARGRGAAGIPAGERPRRGVAPSRSRSASSRPHWSGSGTTSRTARGCSGRASSRSTGRWSRASSSASSSANPAKGAQIGAAINILYLGFISAGGSIPADPSVAGWVGTALALAGGLDYAQALALARADRAAGHDDLLLPDERRRRLRPLRGPQGRGAATSAGWRG